jgi:hypothetical protein
MGAIVIRTRYDEGMESAEVVTSAEVLRKRSGLARGLPIGDDLLLLFCLLFFVFLFISYLYQIFKVVYFRKTHFNLSLL